MNRLLKGIEDRFGRALVIKHALNLYPPYRGAGIRVRRIDPHFRSLEVEMRLRFWNANYFGTHFGGSLYSMVDPHFLFLATGRLGREYIVWDKEATIRFKKPGKGTVRAKFELPDETLERIRTGLETEGSKMDVPFRVDVTDEEGDVVAEVDKLLYV